MPKKVRLFERNKGSQHGQERKLGDRENDIGDRHYGAVDPSADEATHRTKHDCDHGRNQCRQEGHIDYVLAAVDNLGPDIPALVDRFPEDVQSSA